MDLAAKLDGVLPARVGNVVHALESSVGPLHLRPVKASQFLRENVKREDIDARQSTVERVGYAGIQTIGRRKFVVVGRKCRLVEAVVAEADFIHPTRTQDRGPASTGHLGSSVNLRKPLGL